jgi:high affinity sulfate transporter 1
VPRWLFPSLHGYRSGWLRGDLIAGLTVWAVLVPEALAYASIAGVSPVVGLYAAPGALLLYAAFGSSRHLIVGPMSATAALSAATIGEYAAGGSGRFAALTAALAISAGMAALIAGLLRLGFLANFISEPVQKGFIVGLALTIIIGQLPDLLGVDKGSGDFFQKLWHLIVNLGHTHVLTLVVGLGSLAIVFGLRRVAPAVPGSLVAVAAGIAAVEIFKLDRHGVEIVGHVASGLPSLGVPHIGFQQYLKLVGGGIGVMLVGFAEGLGAARTYAARHHYDIDANDELIGLGTANIAAGLSSGMVVNGSLSKTAVNGSAGANTQVSGLLVAVLTILTLLLLTGLFEKLPEPTLAAIVVAAVIELVDFPAIMRLYRVYSGRLGEAYGVAARPDFIAAVAALLGVTIFDTLPGLFIGIGASLVLLLYWASRPRVATLGEIPGSHGDYGDTEGHPEYGTAPGIAIRRVESGLFFANADRVRQTLREAAAQSGVTVVVLDAATVPYVDVSAAEMLAQSAEDLSTRGVSLIVAGQIGEVRDVIRETGVEPKLQAYPDVRSAVEAVSTTATTGA